MIGLFDSGHGGLTVFRELVDRFPTIRFAYLGDHANAPYGNRPSDDVISLTIAGTEQLFRLGCRLVILACNTATAVACRKMQQEWLRGSSWRGHNVLGIVAPTVEVATQTPWAAQTPQYPQKFNTDTIAVFATSRTVGSGVYPEEILKRCPSVRVVQQACPHLVGSIESGAENVELEALVGEYVGDLMAQLDGSNPDWAILGCTHFPLIQDLFRARLPDTVRLLAQPDAVAHSLEDYLERHPDYARPPETPTTPIFLTTGDAERISTTLAPFWSESITFQEAATFDFV